MKKKAKFPYNYKSIGLPNGAVATFTGKPKPKLLEAVTALSEAAKKKLNSDKEAQGSDTTKAK